jgi:hypothetical protein
MLGSMSAWNGWYHCTGSTYGAWLRGDERGCRPRRHHEHCEGDYQQPPPPGKHQRAYAESKRLMKRQRVVLTPAQREVACREFVRALLERDVEVRAFCVGAKHWHGMLRFRDPDRHRGQNRDAMTLIGQAKGKSAREMSRAGVIGPGAVWAARCRVRPIKNEYHFANVSRYIPDHAKKGAAIYVTPPAKPGALAPALSSSKVSRP